LDYTQIHYTSTNKNYGFYLLSNIFNKTKKTGFFFINSSARYQNPTFKLNGDLPHFAAYKNHIEFYPTSSGIEAFKKELSNYETSRGTVRFPLDKPIPFDLVKKIVKFRVKENSVKKQ